MCFRHNMSNSKTIPIAIIAIIIVGVMVAAIAVQDVGTEQVATIDAIPVTQEIQKHQVIDWQDAWANVVPEIGTVSWNDGFEPYTKDSCQKRKVNLEATITLHERRQNMIDDDRNSNTPDQDRIDRMIRDNKLLEKEINSVYNDLVIRDCLKP